MSEYSDFVKQFPEFAFNDNPGKRNKNHHLICFEVFSIHPSSYDLNNCRAYGSVLTYNRKFYDLLKQNKINTVHLINGFPMMDYNHKIDTFIPYENKIDGICLIARVRPSGNNTGDICSKRMEAMENITGMIKHVYGVNAWGGEMYQGVIGTQGTTETYPSSKQKFQKLNQYKFSVCFENCYDKFHSWDYVTEKIFDCFKSKTVPVYYGCYNIEEHVPKELYVDFRDFNNDYEKLSKYLKEFPKSKYIEMTERAFEFQLSSRLGNAGDFKQLLESVK